MNYKLLKNGEIINTIVASHAFVDAYCQEMGYTYEEMPEPETTQTETKPELTTEERIAELENTIAAQDEALIELYEMIGG